jgi:hypothetical protein
MKTLAVAFLLTITITSCGEVSETQSLVTPAPAPADGTTQMSAPDAGVEHAAAAADAGAPEAPPAAPDAVGAANDAGAAETMPPNRTPRCGGPYVVERSCSATCGICKLPDQATYIDGCWLTGTDVWCVGNCLDCGKAPRS